MVPYTMVRYNCTVLYSSHFCFVFLFTKQTTSCDPESVNREMFRIVPVLAKRSLRNVSKFSDMTTPGAHSKNSNTPLIETFRSNWPDPDYFMKTKPEEVLPPRTVSDKVLRFHFTSTFAHGNSIYYPHLKTHAADLKVKLYVS